MLAIGIGADPALDIGRHVMKSTEDRPRGELAKPLDRPIARWILVQGQMRSEPVVIAGVGRKDSALMGFAEDDDVIEAFPVPAENYIRQY
jgi:hypothetical protein